MKDLEKQFEHIMTIVNIPEAAKQCAEITEKECISFAEWIDYNTLSKKVKVYEMSTKELFKLYLKSK